MANDKDFLLKNAVEVGGPTKVTLGSITSSDIDLSTGNYFADTLAANTTYTLSNAGDVQSFQLEVTGGTVYGLSAISYQTESPDLTAQESTLNGVAFKADGTKMYTVGSGNDSVYQYSLSTAWDVSTSTYDSVSLSVASQDIVPGSVRFSSDGSAMYVMGLGFDTVFQYTLSTPWNLGTASYASKSFSVTSQDTNPAGMDFKSDGTKLYITGSTNAIYQYSLSTAWDVSTTSYDSVSFSTATQTTSNRGLTFDGSGYTAYVIDNGSDTAFEYRLSTAWDVTTMSYSGNSYSITQDTNPYNAFVKPDNTRLYIVGQAADIVFQYNIVGEATVTWPSSIEWAGGVAPSAPATVRLTCLHFVTDDGGTSYVGVKTADNLS